MPVSSSRDKPATIYEIAKKAGVSSSTVARVLRGDVKEAWPSTARRAERIRRLADQLGYKANWRARAFSEKRTWTIALFYVQTLQVFEGIHAAIVLGLNDALQLRGYSLMLMPVESENFVNTVQGSRLDGYATLGVALPEDAMKILDESGLPQVNINSNHQPDRPGVVASDYDGGYIAGKHLLDLGHRRIGFYINNDAIWHYSINERFCGIEAAMRDAGLSHGPEKYHVGHDEIMTLLEDDTRRPPAMICYSHFEANPVLSVMYRLNLRVPDVMSVMCFNDVRGEAMSPPMTTVSYDGRRMGKIAAQLLLRRVSGDRVGLHQVITLKHQLTKRQSTAQPRG